MPWEFELDLDFPANSWPRAEVGGEFGSYDLTNLAKNRRMGVHVMSVLWNTIPSQFRNLRF